MGPVSRGVDPGADGFSRLCDLVHAYVDEGGQFVVLTRDEQFLKSIASGLARHVTTSASALLRAQNAEELVEVARKASAGRGKLVMLIERVIDGAPTTQLVKYLKLFHPDHPLVIVTNEIEEDLLALFLELGADNCITKPISPRSIVEKLAYTLRPPGRIARLVEKGKRALLYGDHATALKASEDILALKPKSPAALMLRGDALKALFRMREAEEAYQEASRAANLYIEPLKKLADIYRDAGKDEKRLDILERLDQLSPLNTERKMELGGLLARKGSFETAEAVFDDAVRVATEQAMSLVSDLAREIAGRCMEDKPELAEKYLRRSLESRAEIRRGSDAQTYNALGITLRRQGRWQEACAEYEKAISLAPEDENLHYNLALARHDGGDNREALTALGRTLSLVPDFGQDSAGVCLNMASIYLDAGVNDKAARLARRALEIDPGDIRAKEMLAALDRAH